MRLSVPTLAAEEMSFPSCCYLICIDLYIVERKLYNFTMRITKKVSKNESNGPSIALTGVSRGYRGLDNDK